MSYCYYYDEGDGPELIVYDTHQECVDSITPDMVPYVVSEIVPLNSLPDPTLD